MLREYCVGGMDFIGFVRLVSDEGCSFEFLVGRLGVSVVLVVVVVCSMW